MTQPMPSRADKLLEEWISKTAKDILFCYDTMGSRSTLALGKGCEEPPEETGPSSSLYDVLDFSKPVRIEPKGDLKEIEISLGKMIG